MFIEGDTDGFWDSTREDINERVAMAEKAIQLDMESPMESGSVGLFRIF